MRFNISSFICFAFLVTRCLGQQSGQFLWLFSDSALATEVPTCKSMPIVVKPLNGTGIPPYYMLAFSVGDNGTVITTPIGSDENNLSWTVTSPVGSKLLLSVVDSIGNGGGIPPSFVTVKPGQTTNCVVNSPSNPTFTVQADVKGDLTTCAPWRVTVRGGVPPYNVTLAELNMPVVTNVTIPNGLDAMTYINRALPGNPLIVAVSDLNGNWATGVPSVNAVGSNDTSCPGLSTTFGSAADLEAQDEAISRTKRTRKTAIAVSVTLVLLLLIGLAAFGAFYLRKRRRQAEEELAEAKADQFVIPAPSDSRMLSINNYLDSSPSTYPRDRKGRQNLDVGPSPVSTTNATAGYGIVGYGNTAGPSRPRPNSQVSNPGFVNFPSTSIRRSAKALEAASSPKNPFQDPEDAPPPYVDRTRHSSRTTDA